CYSPGSLNKLIFVRQNECIVFTHEQSDFENKNSPLILEKYNISYPYFKDSIFRRLRNIKKLDIGHGSTAKVLYYVLNNGKAITVKESKLAIVNKNTSTSKCCVIEAPNAPYYLEEFIKYIKTAIKAESRASCGYKPPNKMP